ncbi:unnamed protein product [Closterium sp. Naga37s-1]|nr:unnamed protein product [Closterium sp. Naga37s-1]CAI5531185.1 unnamed protein product [Closterium sp. Naga37s-1]
MRQQLSRSQPPTTEPAALDEPPESNTCELAIPAAERNMQVGEEEMGEVLRWRVEDIRQQWLLFKKEISRGQYGMIRRCVHCSTGEIAACKSIWKAVTSPTHVIDSTAAAADSAGKGRKDSRKCGRSSSSGEGGEAANNMMLRTVLEAEREGFSCSRRWQELLSLAKHLIIWVGAIPCEYPSVSASPFAGGDPSETQLSVAAQVSANGGDPFPSEFISRFPAVGDGGAASGTTAANVALEDWCNEVAASMVQTAAPRVLGRKQRQRLMRQWFDDAPDELVSPALPEVNRTSQVNQVNAFDALHAVNDLDEHPEGRHAGRAVPAMGPPCSPTLLSHPALPPCSPTLLSPPCSPTLLSPPCSPHPDLPPCSPTLLSHPALPTLISHPDSLCLILTFSICAFLPFPPCLVPLAFPTGQSAADVAVTEELNGHIDIFRIKKETQGKLPLSVPFYPIVNHVHVHVHVAMELCEGGDLFDRVVSHGRLSEPSAARIFRSLMLALQHCHSHTIVHRDVKPEIILLSNRAINKDNVNGSAEAREVQVGEVQAGEVQVGEVQAGEVQAREAQVGEVQVGEVQVGEAKVGEVKVGEAKVGEAKVGEAKVGEAKVGETKMGEVRAGELMMRPVEDFRSRACLRVFQTPRGHVQEVYPGPKTLKC